MIPVKLDPSLKETALKLVEAYFDGKDIVMKDPVHGVPDWISINDPTVSFSYIELFCKNAEKYRIIE